MTLAPKMRRMPGKEHLIDRRAAAYNGRCKICQSPHRVLAEHGVASGMSIPAVARKFDLSPDSLQRHWQRHVDDATKTARKLEILKPGADLARLMEGSEIGLLQSLEIIRGTLLRKYEIADRMNDLKAVASISAQLHRNAEMMANHLGELRAHGAQTVAHFLLTPDYLKLRATLLAALRPFPEAAAAVSAALREIDREQVQRLEAPAQLEAELVQ